MLVYVVDMIEQRRQLLPGRVGVTQLQRRFQIDEGYLDIEAVLVVDEQRPDALRLLPQPFCCGIEAAGLLPVIGEQGLLQLLQRRRYAVAIAADIVERKGGDAHGQRAEQDDLQPGLHNAPPALSFF